MTPGQKDILFGLSGKIIGAEIPGKQKMMPLNSLQVGAICILEAPDLVLKKLGWQRRPCNETSRSQASCPSRAGWANSLLLHVVSLIRTRGRSALAAIINAKMRLSARGCTLKLFHDAREGPRHGLVLCGLVLQSNVSAAAAAATSDASRWCKGSAHLPFAAMLTTSANEPEGPDTEPLWNYGLKNL